MKIFRMHLVLLGAGLVILIRPQPSMGQQPADLLKSSPKIVQAFRPVVAKAGASTVRIYCDGKEAALGVITGADGWILTKAGLLTGKITCKLKDGRELPARLVGVHEPCDLAMLKIDAAGLTPVVWQDSKVAAVGRWMASVGTGTDPVAIGVVSVATRPYKAGDQPPKTLNDKSGFLGVGLEEAEGGAKVKTVMPKSAAAKAGLKVDDIVTQVNKKKIVDAESLINAVGRYKPGAEIVLKIKRGKEKLELKAVLGKRPPGMLGNVQDRMGSVLSNRRGGFPWILQHDSVLKPGDCGSPLVDLDGKVVGLNIARAGRTETYAIPAETIREVLADLMAGNLPPAPKDE